MTSISVKSSHDSYIVANLAKFVSGIDGPLQSTGRCSSRLARKNEQCDPNNCDCEQGMSIKFLLLVFTRYVNKVPLMFIFTRYEKFSLDNMYQVFCSRQ